MQRMVKGSSDNHSDRNINSDSQHTHRHTNTKTQRHKDTETHLTLVLLLDSAAPVQLLDSHGREKQNVAVAKTAPQR